MIRALRFPPKLWFSSLSGRLKSWMSRNAKRPHPVEGERPSGGPGVSQAVAVCFLLVRMQRVQA